MDPAKQLPDSVSVDGETVGGMALVAGRGYRGASSLERVWYTVVGIFAKEYRR